MEVLKDLKDMAPFIVIGSLIVGGNAWKFLKLRRLRAQNFDWYKASFPQLVSEREVRCHKCNGTSIGTERLMRRSFVRAHTCRRCGTTLYHSKE